jgi:hypothetical protein
VERARGIQRCTRAAHKGPTGKMRTILREAAPRPRWACRWCTGRSSTHPGTPHQPYPLGHSGGRGWAPRNHLVRLKLGNLLLLLMG